MQVFRRLRAFYQPYVGLLVVSLVLLAATIALGLVYPYIVRLIIDKVIVQREFGLILPYLSIMVAAALVKGLVNFGQQFLGQLFGIKSSYDLRNALYKKLNHQPFEYYDSVHTGDLMSRLTGDLDAFRQFLAFGFNSIVNFVLLVVFGLCVMVSLNVWLTLAVICLLPALAFVAIKFDNLLWPAYKAVRKSIGQLNTKVQENITGVRTVKSFAREPYEVDKFTERNQDYYDTNVKTAMLWKRFFPYMELIGNLEVVVVWIIGGLFVLQQRMTLGDLVAFLSILWTITMPMGQLGYLLNTWTQSLAAGERLLEILDADNNIQSPVDAHRSDVLGHVRFNGVGLNYDGQKVLSDIVFEAKPGQTIALLGGTGSGKSSIVNLIPRFYDVTSGAVTVDGVDVRNWDLNALRRGVSVVFQESFLFSTTIFANIAYGHPDATMADVQRAARLADAAEFIERLPEGYSTLVGERGLGLSGGQKQRIALARAILANPSILILDDATSAVDMETEYEIQQALLQVMEGRTTFIIAHRISSLKRADLILVLEDGRIIQRGTHEQLLAEDGYYKRVFNMQFKDHDQFAGAVESAATLRPAAQSN